MHYKKFSISAIITSVFLATLCFAADPVDLHNDFFLLNRGRQINDYGEKALFEMDQRDKAEALFNHSMGSPDAMDNFMLDIDEIMDASQERAKQKALPNGGKLTPEARRLMEIEYDRAEMAAIDRYINPETLDPLTAKQKAYMKEYIAHRDRFSRMQEAFNQLQKDTGFEIFKKQKDALDLAAEREYGKNFSDNKALSSLAPDVAAQKLDAAQTEYNDLLKHIRRSSRVTVDELRQAAQLEKDMGYLRRVPISTPTILINPESAKIMTFVKGAGKVAGPVGIATTLYDLVDLNNAEYALTTYMAAMKECHITEAQSTLTALWNMFWGRTKQAGVTIGINTGLDDIAQIVSDAITKGSFGDDVKKDLQIGIAYIKKNCSEIFTELKKKPRFIDGLKDMNVHTVANPLVLELNSAPEGWWQRIIQPPSVRPDPMPFEGVLTL